MPVTSFQTATPTPGVGPAALVGYGPVLARLAWFLGGVVVAVVGWYVVEPAVSRALARRNEDNPTIREAIFRYVRLVAVVVGVFAGAGLAGYGRFVADSALVIAAGTLVAGVAGQTVIGSLISGLVPVTDPEFKIGNYIFYTDGEGTVQSITLRVTRIHAPEGELVTIPNTVLTGQTITRPYGRRRRRLAERVDIAYEDDVDRALDILKDAAGEMTTVLADPPPTAVVEEFGSDAVILRVYYWVGGPRSPDLREVESTYARTVKRRLGDAGITLAPAAKREILGHLDVGERR
ncbi:MAG: mechanosensitive ion channel family protein [Haloplanus sp.]